MIAPVFRLSFLLYRPTSRNKSRRLTVCIPEVAMQHIYFRVFGVILILILLLTAGCALQNSGDSAAAVPTAATTAGIDVAMDHSGS